MKFLHHASQQPFIFATGLAALVHSTWSLGVLFAGEPPTVTDVWTLLQFLWWLLPAFFIAFAMDVGQIATSSEIRDGQRTRMKYGTFAVFSLATYYLQWLYISHHMPALALAEGVRQSWEWLATLMRDAAVWIIPALLPLSTLLYTLSGGSSENVTEQNSGMVKVAPLVTGSSVPEIPAEITNHEPLQGFEEPDEERYSINWLHEIVAQETKVVGDEDVVTEQIGSYGAYCESCGWEGGRQYDKKTSAARALAAHRRTCTALHPEIYSNGHNHKES